MQKNIEFYQGLVTCNNKASIEERKELIKYGGKMFLILLVAVCGIKIVTAALEIPLPQPSLPKHWPLYHRSTAYSLHCQ